MRVGVLIIGLILGGIMFLQAVIVGGLSEAIGEEETSNAAAWGVFMALLWLIACAVVIPLPRVAAGLFVGAGAIGIIAATSSEFADLGVWGGVSLVLAVMAYFGYRGKQRADAKERERDELLRQAIAGRQSEPPTSEPG